jgi:hypothetical protein
MTGIGTPSSQSKIPFPIYVSSGGSFLKNDRLWDSVPAVRRSLPELGEPPCVIEKVPTTEMLMRKLILATLAAVIVAAPLATAVKAEDTTIIKKDSDGDRSKTVIKKNNDVNLLPVPHTEERKTIIKKEHDND